MTRMACIAAVTAVCLGGAAPARAEVIDAAPGGFTVRVAVDVEAPAAAVYRTLTEVGAWWAPAHTWSGDAANLSLDPVPGGCFCEKLPGGGVRHMVVVYADPGKMLRLSGALGPLQSMAVTGTLTWTLTARAGGTGIEMTYAVGGYLAGGLGAVAPAVDGVLTEQVRRLQRAVKAPAGAPDR